MSRTVKLDGDPSQGSERAPKGAAKPRAAKRAAPREGGSGGASSGATTPPTPKITGNDAKLHASLVRFYGMAGMGLRTAGTMKGDLGLATAGVNIVATASDTADAWIELAQQNPRVRKVLEGFVQGSAAANLAGAHIAMVLPVLAARGVVPPQMGAMFLSDEAQGFYRDSYAAAAATNGSAPTV